MGTVRDMLNEMVAPGSKATRNERDAAAEVLRTVSESGPDAGKMPAVPRCLARLILAYYEREHQGAMQTHLRADGA